jgi:hypothetical protein
MRRSKYRNSYDIVTPEIRTEFDSLTEAYKFYNLYSWEIGFGIKMWTISEEPCKELSQTYRLVTSNPYKLDRVYPPSV